MERQPAGSSKCYETSQHPPQVSIRHLWAVCFETAAAEAVGLAPATIRWEPVGDTDRLKGMRIGVVLLAFSVLVAACGTEESTGGDPGTNQTAEMMAAALVELITEDPGFGEGSPPFTEYLIQNRIDPSAGKATGSPSESVRQLSDLEREAIEEAVREYGVVRWIDDPSDWQTPDLAPTIEGAAILGVGEPVIEANTGLVPVSMWCGGLCGTWLTYRLDMIDDVWVVTGIEGPIAVS